MTTRNLWVVFAILLFPVAMAGLAWGQSSSLGVKAGDTFVFSYSLTWESNQTGVEPPSSIRDQGDLQYIASAILEVNNVSVTSNTSYCYSNGMLMEIATSDYGGGYVPFFIPPNLGAGDLIPLTNLENSPNSACYINDTINQSFGSQTRAVDHLQIEFPFEGFAGVSCNAYWDQATGVMTQVAYSYSNQTGDTITTWSVTAKLTDTNVFVMSDSQSPFPSSSVPEISSIAVALLMAVLFAVTILYRKRLGKDRI